MRSRAVVMVAVWLVACNGTSTGNPFDDDGEEPTGHAGEEGGDCEREASELAGVDAVSPLGFSAADVLAFSAGLHETAIRWQPSRIASYGPETGEHALSLRVTHAGGEARYVEYSEAEDDLHAGEEPAIDREPCESLNAVEVDVEVEVTTDGGALDERATATLHATSTRWATLRIPLDADELGGEFAVTETRPAGYRLVQLALEFGLSPLGLRGTFGGVFEMRTADAVSAGAGGPLATIGADESCDDGGLPVAIDDALEGMSGQDALDRVNQLATLSATWRDGTTTTVALQLAHDGAGVCALLEPGSAFDPTTAGTLRLRGTLAAQSEDQRLDASWPVVVQATPAETGGLGDVSVSLDEQAIGAIAGSELAAVSGVSGLDGTGYDSVSIGLRLELAAGGGASGELAVNGFHNADCPTAPPEPQPGGGSGSPGCPGATLVEIESLTMSDR
jgi:hypothetical protein